MEKLVISASAKFEKEILEWKNKLGKNFDVTKYPEKISGDFLINYSMEFKNHYSYINDADILFILNLEKNGKKGYIGPGVFAEIAYAIGLNLTLGKKIKIYLLNNFADDLMCSEELSFWLDLGWIKMWSEKTPSI